MFNKIALAFTWAWYRLRGYRLTLNPPLAGPEGERMAALRGLWWIKRRRNGALVAIEYKPPFAAALLEWLDNAPTPSERAASSK